MPLAADVRVYDDLASNPGRILCVVEGRPLLDTIRLVRFSLCSTEELGLLLEMIAFLELLPYREELRPLSGSGC